MVSCCRHERNNYLEIIALTYEMKVIFLDFDGVMDTAYYDNYLNYMGLQEHDKYGVVFDPDCIANLKRIIDATGADIVVSSTWKDFMTYKEILEVWEYSKSICWIK